MARFLSQTLIRGDSPAFFLRISPPLRLLNHRNRSNRPEKAQLIEITIDSSEDSDVELLGLQNRLEDAIHAVIARRSAPDWLPFLPGSSYWVAPPRKLPFGLVEVVGKLANGMSEEEMLSMTSLRGWPSTSCFLEGGAPHPAKTTSKKKATESEDEEG